MTGADEARVFFTNSGTEANEAAFKITRMTGRSKIISTEGAFHGRSMGALALTHNPKYRLPFEPLPGEVIFVPYGDAEALAAVVDETVAAVVLEPIQGENGVVVPPAATWPRHGRSAISTGPCCGWTRCRPGWAAAAAGWSMSTKALPPTSSLWRRVWATASRSEPASPPDRPRGCSARAVTAARSAATR